MASVAVARSDTRRHPDDFKIVQIRWRFDSRPAWGFSTISNDKVRFVVATEAYGVWWRRNRRPRRRERLAMLKRQGKIPKHV